MAGPDPIEFLRQKLVQRVRATFNDVEGGQQPVPPSEQALFAKDSPIRMVHADVVGMMVGGVRALLLQMLHPHALQGVLDHSDFRNDMHGRLRRTARFIAVTTFGHRDEAEKAIARVNRIHAAVSGIMPDGTSYEATNPRTLAWVHVTEALSFLEGYKRFVNPTMTRREQDEYFRQFAVIAHKLGADPVPETLAQAEALFRDMRTELRSSPEAIEIGQLVLTQRPEAAPAAVQQAIATSAVEMLPPFARSMLGLARPGLGGLAARAATFGAGKTLRWAFRQN